MNDLQQMKQAFGLRKAADLELGKDCVFRVRFAETHPGRDGIVVLTSGDRMLHVIGQGRQDVKRLIELIADWANDPDGSRVGGLIAVHADDVEIWCVRTGSTQESREITEELRDTYNFEWSYQGGK